MVARELLIKFVADTNQFVSGTNKAVGGLQKFTGEAKKLGSVLTGGIIGGGAIYGMMRLGRVVLDTLNKYDQLAKNARRVGLSAREFQTLSLAAEQSGLGVERASKMVDIYNRRVGEANMGMGGSLIKSALSQVGLDAAELSKLSTIEGLQRFADGLKNINSTTEKTAILMNFFGRTGAEAALFFDNYASALERAGKATKTLISDEDFKKVEEAKDRLSEMGVTWENAKAKSIVGVANWFSWWQDLGTAHSRIFFSENADPPVRLSDEGAKLAAQYLKEEADEQARLNKLRVEANQILGDTTTAQDKYIQSGTTLANALYEGIITEDQAKEAMKKVEEEFKKSIPEYQAATKYAEQYSDKLKDLSDRYKEIIDLSESHPDLITGDVQQRALSGIAGEALGQFDVTGGDAAERYASAMAQLNAAAGSLSPEFLAQTGAIIADTFSAERAEELQSFAGALQQATATPMEQFNAQMQALNDALNEGAISWELYARGAEQAGKALWETTEAAQYMRELQSFAQSEFMATRNPFEEYNMHMRKLNDAMAMGLVDWDTYNRSMMQAAGNMDKALGLDQAAGESGLQRMITPGMMGIPGLYTTFHPGQASAPSGPGTAGFATASQIDAIISGSRTENVQQQQLQEQKKITGLLTSIVRESPAGIFL